MRSEAIPAGKAKFFYLDDAYKKAFQDLKRWMLLFSLSSCCLDEANSSGCYF